MFQNTKTVLWTHANKLSTQHKVMEHPAKLNEKAHKKTWAFVIKAPR